MAYNHRILLLWNIMASSSCIHWCRCGHQFFHLLFSYDNVAITSSHGSSECFHICMLLRLMIMLIPKMEVILHPSPSTGRSKCSCHQPQGTMVGFRVLLNNIIKQDSWRHVQIYGTLTPCRVKETWVPRWCAEISLYLKHYVYSVPTQYCSYFWKDHCASDITTSLKKQN